MKEIYEYLLKNSTFDNLIKNYIQGNRIAIIRNNEKSDYVINYLQEYILNNATVEGVEKKYKDLNSCYNLDSIKSKKLIVLNREINNNKRNIINTFLTFIEKDNLGRSLNDLYSITKKSLDFKDESFRFFSILSKCKEVIGNEEETVVEEIDKIIAGNYINIYIKYLKFKGNKKFEIIKDNIDVSDIKKIITKLSGILNNSFAFMPPIYNNEYTSDFENEEIYYKNYTPEQLLEEVKKINYKHNKKLLGEIVDIKWYKFSQIFNYKKITNKNKQVQDAYYKREKEIYNQYMENIDNLKLFSSSFKFLTKVFKEKVLDEIDGIELDKLLIAINERIEFLLDRDHLIGHAYFVNCNSYSDIINVVINKIIPLLQEYFYGDNEKVGMILGGIGSSEGDKYIVYKEEKSANKIFKGFKNISDIGSKEFFRVKSNIGIEELKNIYED